MSEKNLESLEAIEKIKELAESIDVTMMCTMLAQKPFHAIPMSTKAVDATGKVWFLSSRTSHHNHHIRRDNTVQLLYSHPGTMQFLNIFGTAEISTDRNILERLYEATDDA